MDTYIITIIHYLTKRKRTLDINAFNIGEAYDCIIGSRKINNTVEDIIKIEKK